MKTRLPFSGSCAVLLLTSAFAAAQTPIPPVSFPQVVPAQPVAGSDAAQPELKLTPAQIDDLMGPIALYPDPLIAQILPAATYPTDIVLAARMVARGATRDELDSQEWDPSVKALSHYPSIIKMMDERLDWTQQVGAVFARQPDDVMDSVQRLRAKARALGHLQDSPQQKVIVETAEPQTTVVRIVPAQPEVVYVPTYEPQVVYYQPYTTSYVASPYIWFGAGFAIGAWLNLDCDWYYGRCYYPSWSWSYCGYPWRYGYGYGYGYGCYGGYGYYNGHRNYWCGSSYSRYCGPNYYYSDRVASRTNDAHYRSWSRNDSRPAPHLRSSYRSDDWASNRSSASGSSVPGHRRTVDGKSALRADTSRSERISSTSRLRSDSTSRQGISPDSLRRSPDSSRRTLSPSQVQERLSRTTPSSRYETSPRVSTSPRASDRTIPDARPRTSTPSNSDALRRTRQLPPTNNGRAINRGSNGSITVPGSGDVRGRPAVRTVTPNRSASPSNRSISPTNRSTAPRASSPSPSTGGRRGLQLSPSRSSAPRASSPSSRQAAPRSSPSRSSAPASRGGSGSGGAGNRRSK